MPYSKAFWEGECFRHSDPLQVLAGVCTVADKIVNTLLRAMPFSTVQGIFIENVYEPLVELIIEVFLFPSCALSEGIFGVRLRG